MKTILGNAIKIDFLKIKLNSTMLFSNTAVCSVKFKYCQ